MSTTASVAGLVLALLCGSSSGLLFRRFVGWIFQELDDAVRAEGEAVPEHAGIWSNIGLLLMGGLFAGGLWLWEVICGGMLPEGVTGPATTDASVFGRVAVHFIFFWLLSAAAWVDLRHRVIPDVITTPGVLLGLLAAWGLPSCLLPIQVAHSRSFASPIETTDVLAAWGPLISSDKVDTLVGLGVALLVFCMWWWKCTTPFFFDPSEQTSVTGLLGKSWYREPRYWVLLVGILLIALSSQLGGLRFAALVSSLIGLAVSASLVWLTRTGASLALGREAMGMGDVTLMAMVGAWLGWQPSIMVFFLATFIGLGHGLFQMIRHREHELPYGPSLCLAAALVTFFWILLWPRVEYFFGDVLQLGLMLGLVVILTAVTLFIWRWLRGLGEMAA